MVDEKTYSVAIIGCGRLGQHYATAYSTYPDTEVVAIAEYNSDRRRAVGERFGVKALYPGNPCSVTLCQTSLLS